MKAAAQRTPDAARGWVDQLPGPAQAYARLARLDRPIGAWLLYWPCAWGLALSGGLRESWPVLLLLLLGAFAMRAAGCVWNDIVDRDLDAKVERTRGRPIPSGAVTVRAALAWMVALALIGLAVLLCLRPFAQMVALASLVLVAVYPFVKRVSWWPQAWLGLTFNWGALVGYAEGAGQLDATALVLYGAGTFWTLGYDTIYAVQDIEDDALAGVRSSARALGNRVREGVAAFYFVAVLLLTMALVVKVGVLRAAGVVPFALHLLWQASLVRERDGTVALRLFRTNRDAGLLGALACLLAGLA